MNPERWHQIEEMYHRAQSWNADEREVALKQACGSDDELYREVQSFLAAGVVYRAFDMRLNRPVAIKVLADELVNREARLRFQREARLPSSLNHPHILTVFDVGECDGCQYLVTELIDQGTLRDWLKAGPRTWRQVVELLAGVADDVAAAHAAGIQHRDIKPENILVARNGYAKSPLLFLFTARSPKKGPACAGPIRVESGG